MTVDHSGHQFFQTGTVPGPDLAPGIVPHHSVNAVYARIADCEASVAFGDLRNPFTLFPAGFADSRLKVDVLQQGGVVDTVCFQQDPVLVQDVPGGIDIDLILPFDVVAIGNVAHIRRHLPGMHAGFKQGAGNLVVAAILSGDQAEFHLDTG